MSQSKPLHELTEEELLESLKNIHYQSKDAFELSILSFLSVYKISPGKDLIAFSTIYSLYKLWSKTIVSKEIILIEMQKRVPTKVVRGTLFFKINRNFFDLNAEIEKEIHKKRTVLKQSRAAITQMHNFVRHYEFKPGNNPWSDAILHALLRRYAIERKTKFVDFVSMLKWFKIKKYSTGRRGDRYTININRKPEELFTSEDLKRHEEAWKKNIKKIRKKSKI